MKITAITKQVKRDNRVNVFVDEEYVFSLTLGQLAEAGIKKGDELTADQIASFKQLSSTGKLEELAINWAMRRHHSEREIRDYLARKTPDEGLQEELLLSLKRLGFVDDERFAAAWAEQRRRRGYSAYVIKGELLKKGVAQELTDEQLAEAPDEQTTLRQLIEAKQLTRRYKDKSKLIAYLSSKGYRYGDIKEVIEEL